MSEIELKQRLRDAEKAIDVARDDARRYQRAFTDAVTQSWRLRYELQELRDRQLARGNDVY